MNSNNKKLVNQIIKDIEHDANDEEVLHMLLESKVSANINKKQKDAYTFGQRAADKIAKFAGSWTFIIIFCLVLVIWMIINVVFLMNPFDPYPFILLNLVLSCIAAIQAPLVMMSQNRQEQKDRLRSENDYKVNLKTEIVIEDLHNKLDKLLSEQEKIKKTLAEIEKSEKK